MDRFSELEAFVAVAEAGGFNAAARRLNRSPPTVTRLVSALEARIQARLFTRTTRQVALTEAGAQLFREARRLLEAWRAAEAAAAGAFEEPIGVLSVTAPVIFGRRYVAPLLRAFAEAHPRVVARAVFVDRVAHLVEEGLDVAVRLGELPDSSLTAVKVGEVRRVVVAAPRYVAEQGAPETPEGLAAHRLAAPGLEAREQRWEFAAAGAKRVVPIAPALMCDSIDVSIDAALEGWAIARVMSYQVADAVKEGRLVELLAAFEDRRTPVHLVHAEGPLRAAKVRAFVETATRELRREAPSWRL
ncbi:MAG: LysR family transcriptional regulator [Pseudomonadota bacterium]